MNGSSLLLIALAIPLCGAVGMALTQRVQNVRETITLLTAGTLFVVVAMLLPQVLAGGRPEAVLFELFPDVPFAFRLEPLGMLYALIASSLWIVNSIYSIGYMRANAETGQTRFYVCFALAIASAIGIAFAGNLLTLFIFYEALTLSTYPLVAHHGDQAAKRGARTYVGVLLVTSIVFFLVAIIVTYFIAGTLEFSAGGILAGKLGSAGTAVLLALFVFGIGKAALMPVHRWLPAAMVAPTPVSALLHAVAVVKAGVFCVVKVVVYVFGLDFLAVASAAEWLPCVAGFTIVAASIVALRSDNLKRRLAYSTVSQLSYVVLAAALLAPISVVGATLHIVAHAFGKITLFFAAGAIYTVTHKTEVSQLAGIGRRMPWTMLAFAVGTLSMIGLPPAAGFVSKWFILAGAMATQHWTAVAVIAVSTLLNAAYFVPIVYSAFLRAPDAATTAHGEAPWPMVLAMGITAAGTLALFFYADTPIALAQQLAAGG